MGKLVPRKKESKSAPKFTHNPVAKSITNTDKVSHHRRKAHRPAKTLTNTAPFTDMKEKMENPNYVDPKLVHGAGGTS
jgi:hypothetical protein